jgi:hypothetical protein
VGESEVGGGEKHEGVTRITENISGRPEDVGGRRKTRRSVAAETENLDIDVD